MNVAGDWGRADTAVYRSGSRWWHGDGSGNGRVFMETRLVRSSVRQCKMVCTREEPLERGRYRWKHPKYRSKTRA